MASTQDYDPVAEARQLIKTPAKAANILRARAKYSLNNVIELADMLRSRNLPCSGKKAVLISRLEAYDRRAPIISLSFHPSGQFPFMRLPGELRNRIYNEILANGKNPEITQSCRAIYREANQLVYRERFYRLRITNGHFKFRGNLAFATRRGSNHNTRSRPFNPWNCLPANLRRVENLTIVLSIKVYYVRSNMARDHTNAVGANLNTAAYTLLLKHEHLRHLRLSFDIVGETFGSLSAEKRAIVEEHQRRCLETVSRLRGLSQLTFEGLVVSDQAFIASIRQQVLQPRTAGRQSLFNRGT